MMRFGQFLIRHRRRIFIWTVTCLAVFTLAGFFIVPPILKSILSKQLTAALHRDVGIREVRVNPFTLSASLRGVAVKEPEASENFVSFEELYVNLETASLFRWGVVVKEVRLTKPFIHVVRRQDESYNFSDLLAGRESQPTAPATKPPRFSVNNIRIIDGGADFQDELVHAKHTIREVNVGIPFLSNIPSDIQTFVQPHLSAVINGTRYSLEGKTKPFADSQETTLDVNIADLDLPYYLAYVPQDLLTFAIPSGRLDAKLVIVFVRQRATGQTLAVKGDVGLRDLVVDDKKGNPVVRIPSFGVGLASVEPFVRKVHLAKIALQAPELTVRREKTGMTNLESLVPPTETKAPASGPNDSSSRLSLDIDKVEVAQGTIRFFDLSNPLPFKATIAPIQFSADQVSNAPDKKGTFALTLQTDAKEEVAVNGELSIEPLQATGTVDVKAIPLMRYAPYYADRIQFDIQDARLDLSARYEFAKAQGGDTVKISDLSANLKSLRLREQGAPADFLTVPMISITDTEADLGQKRLRVGGVSTKGGRLAVRRDKGGEVYLLRLFRPAVSAGEPSAPQEAGPAEKPWQVELGRLVLDQYTVTTEDNRPSVPITLVKENVQLTAENLSTTSKAAGKVSLSFLLDRTATVSIKGNLVLDSPRMDGSLEVKNLGLSTYAPYYRDRILFDVEAGTLNLSTNYRYADAPDGPQFALTGLAATVDALRLRRPGEAESFVTIPLLSTRNVAVNLDTQELSVGEVSTREGVVRIKRAPNGELDILRLIPPPAAPQDPQAGQAGTAAVIGPGGGQPQPPSAWSVKLGNASVDRYRIHVKDETPAEPVSLVVEDVNLKAENLSTAQGQTGKTSLALRLDKSTFSSEGSVGLTPVVADLHLALKELDVRPFQPYFADKVKITLTDGRVSTEGRLRLSIKEPTGLQATFAGDTTLGKFAAIDKLSSEDVLKWESLALREISVGYNPLRVHAKRVALADFFAQVLIQPNGRLNLQEIVQSSAEAKPTEPSKPAPQPTQTSRPEPPPRTAPGAPTDIQIEEVTLQNGHIQFTDRSLKPSFSADMSEIGGRVSGLSSEETSLADLELRGKMNNSAPLEITGRINPLKQDLFVDLRARFTGMDLSPTSPYSGKYAGYTIQKGKLSFDLKYLINKGKLDSENKVFIDQFTFGEKVDSPTATNLPVRLAVALLKDRNGEIHLDLPVTGSLDDPKFSVWGIIFQILGNLITKAVTSPFALLGAAFGGGEQLQYVEFDYGRAAISDDAAKKLKALVTALSEKPSLKLEIAGHVDLEADREGLKQYLLQRKVKAQKLNDLVKKGSPAVPVDEVTVEPAEYEKYLTLAYRAEEFPKPRNFIGMLKSLPVPEMEKLILTHIEVGEEELRQLASQRANAVKEGILSSGKVDAERLFLVEPKSLVPEKKEKLKGSRVEFKIG